MVKLYKVTALINGIERTCEIVAKEPNYFQYENRIKKAFDLGKRTL